MAAAAVVLLVLFLVRPGGSRLKSKIILSLSAAVGRPVDVGSVHVRLLPRPGFDLEGLVVYDDASFSSEPMLRAGEVTADLRLMSLLRGRLEVARLNLTEPSLNMVHRVGGGWNVESLLERTARMPLAPTGRPKSEPRPRFPYIEGTSARINFKNGPEKKPYALTNADFSLWQESENAWGVRLRAQPFRSDMNLNDTGEVRLDGIWQRAASISETPLNFNVAWTRAQLGQLTKFFSGNDKGWRGEIELDGTVTGTPAVLKISSTVAADDFRRYDITSGKPLRLATRCDVEYHAHDHQFEEIACNAPVGTGLLKLTGSAGLPGSHHYALEFTAEKVPAGALATVAQRVKKNLPEDLTVDGSLQGKFSINEDAGTDSKPRFEGRGEIAELVLRSETENVEVGPQTLPFQLTGAATGGSVHGRSAAASVPEERIELGPFAIEHRNGAGSIRGWLAHSGYGFSVIGEAEAGRTLRLARLLGLPAPSTAAQGVAQLNLQIAGSWAGFQAAQIAGSAKLRDVHFALRSASEPVDIGGAELQFSPDQLRVTKLSAQAAGTTWRGTVEIPRGCGRPENCTVHFSLSTDQFSLGQVNEWEKPSKKRPWYRVLESGQNTPSLLSRVRASGRITADRLELHNLSAAKVSAMVTLAEGRVELESLSADLFGGKHSGKWVADFGVKPAACSGSGELSGLSLRSVSEAMKESWIEGTGSATYEIKGPCTAAFWQASEGELEQVNITNGSFPRVFLGDHNAALRIQKFKGQVRLHNGTVEVSEGQLNAPEAKYELSGTAGLDRQIDFKITRDGATGSAAAYTVTGTLAQPRVEQVSGPEQARLKPLQSK